MTQVRPQQPAPGLEVQTLDGDSWKLSERRPDAFNLVVFYRGHHCPICRAYLGELSGQLAELENRGVETIAVSGDTRERAERSREEWDLDGLTVGYGFSPDDMRRWGLFVSRAIKDEEPDEFSEPGLFLVSPDHRVFYAGINSMPFGRPGIEDIKAAVDFVTENAYPARGEA